MAGRVPEPQRPFRDGVLAMLPLVPAVVAFGASFGVLAVTAGFSWLAAAVMSATTFAGSAQVAVVSILGAGGSVASAIVAALLLNARYGAISAAIGPSFRGSLRRRLLQSQLIVDESWALSLRADGRVEPLRLVGAGATLWLFWTGGTVVGGLVGGALGDPARLGLDGAFPALFLALLAPQLRSRSAFAAALVGAAVALALTPLTPAGVPIVVATVGCLAGWRRR